MWSNYVFFSYDSRGNLAITLTPEGREEVESMRESGKSDWDIFIDLTERYRCNGWEFVTPEEIGALLSDDEFILTEDCERDDNGNLLRIGKVYYYHASAIRSEVDVMMENGYVILGMEE